MIYSLGFGSCLVLIFRPFFNGATIDLLEWSGPCLRLVIDNNYAVQLRKLKTHDRLKFGIFIIINMCWNTKYLDVIIIDMTTTQNPGEAMATVQSKKLYRSKYRTCSRFLYPQAETRYNRDRYEEHSGCGCQVGGTRASGSRVRTRWGWSNSHRHFLTRTAVRVMGADEVVSSDTSLRLWLLPRHADLSCPRHDDRATVCGCYLGCPRPWKYR